MTKVRWVIAPVAVVLLGTTVGCGQGAAEANTPQQTCTTTNTASGLTVALATTPCPIKGGQSASARVTIKDSAGAAVTDATVKLVPDMPSMGMKGGEQAATANGDGYDTKLVLGMGGEWNVRVLVTRGSAAPADILFTLNAG